MNTSSQFIVAIHILVALATHRYIFKHNHVLTSKYLAKSVNTNAVVIRRTIGKLKKARLITSQPGINGGSVLARSPGQITLDHVYDAVEEGELFHLHYCTPNQRCYVGKNIQNSMQDVLMASKISVKKELSTKTINDLSQDVMKQAGIIDMLNSGKTVSEIEKLLNQQLKI